MKCLKLLGPWNLGSLNVKRFTGNRSIACNLSSQLNDFIRYFPFLSIMGLFHFYKPNYQKINTEIKNKSVIIVSLSLCLQ